MVNSNRFSSIRLLNRGVGVSSVSVWPFFFRRTCRVSCRSLHGDKIDHGSLWRIAHFSTGASLTHAFSHVHTFVFFFLPTVLSIVSRATFLFYGHWYLPSIASFIYDYCSITSRIRCIRVMNRRLNIDGLLHSHLRGKPARIIYNLYGVPLYDIHCALLFFHEYIQIWSFYIWCGNKPDGSELPAILLSVLVR